ncbi:transposase [Streptomyces sp. NPDC087901]|uniref:transposase n=1 Tax=Streptomyces sp. NPDC087901 TaxID=3365818 RepID=UPI0038091742
MPRQAQSTAVPYGAGRRPIPSQPVQPSISHGRAALHREGRCGSGQRLACWIGREGLGPPESIHNAPLPGRCCSPQRCAPPSCPLSWRLFLHGSWDNNEAADRRARWRIREQERHRLKWQLALDMVAELAAVGLRPAVQVADTGYEHRLPPWLGRPHAESALRHQPPYGGLGPRPPRYRARPVRLREHVMAAGRARTVTVTWHKGSKAAMSARFDFLRVRLASRRPKTASNGVIALRWLITQWPEGGNRAGQALDFKPAGRHPGP